MPFVSADTGGLTASVDGHDADRHVERAERAVMGVQEMLSYPVRASRSMDRGSRAPPSSRGSLPMPGRHL